DYKQKGNKVELLGKETVDSTEAYKLKVTLKNGDVRNLYLDSQRFLEVRTEGKRTMQGTEIDFVSAIGDYRNVDGLWIAHSIEKGAKGMAQKQKVQVEKVELNVDTPDTLFAVPAGVTPAKTAAEKAPSAGKTDGKDAGHEAVKPSGKN